MKFEEFKNIDLVTYSNSFCLEREFRVHSPHHKLQHWDEETKTIARIEKNLVYVKERKETPV